MFGGQNPSLSASNGAIQKYTISHLLILWLVHRFPQLWLMISNSRLVDGGFPRMGLLPHFKSIYIYIRIFHKRNHPYPSGYWVYLHFRNLPSILWMVAKSCTTLRNFESLTKKHGMFTTYQLVIRISQTIHSTVVKHVTNHHKPAISGMIYQV